MNRGRRLAARLGLDRNSPRRRTDKIAAYGALGLLAVFLVGAPVLSVRAGEAGTIIVPSHVLTEAPATLRWCRLA